MAHSSHSIPPAGWRWGGDGVGSAGKKKGGSVVFSVLHVQVSTGRAHVRQKRERGGRETFWTLCIQLKDRQHTHIHTQDSGVCVLSSLLCLFGLKSQEPGKQAWCQVAVVVCWSTRSPLVIVRLRASKHLRAFSEENESADTDRKQARDSLLSCF